MNDSAPAPEAPRRPLKRRLGNALAVPLIKGILHLLWKTCRVTVHGDEHARRLMAEGQPFIPAYWHQQHVFCAWYLLRKQREGLKLGFLISPSKDGDVAARIMSDLGARVIRGSSNRTGARAIRDLYQVMAKERISPVNTADGPTGPAFRFKPGAVMLAQLTGYPVLPLAYAAASAWELSSWDRFRIPRPFSRVCVVVGEPRYVDRKTAMHDQDDIAGELEATLNRLGEEAASRLRGETPA